MNSHAFIASNPCVQCIPVTVKMTVRVVVAWCPRGGLSKKNKRNAGRNTNKR